MTVENILQFKRPEGNIAIFCAIPPEFEGLRQVYIPEKIEHEGKWQYFVTENGLVIFLGGMGETRAAEACSYVQERWNSKTFVDFGVAGALVAGLAIGDLVFYKKDIGVNFPEFKIEGNLRITSGKITSKQEEVMTLNDRMELAKESDAIAISWETNAIEQFANKKGIHFYSVRMISDVDFINIKNIRSREMLRMIRLAAENLKKII
jgi:nucleoside phosphorylase